MSEDNKDKGSNRDKINALEAEQLLNYLKIILICKNQLSKKDMERFIKDMQINVNGVNN